MQSKTGPDIAWASVAVGRAVLTSTDRCRSALRVPTGLARASPLGVLVVGHGSVVRSGVGEKEEGGRRGDDAVDVFGL